MRSSKEANRRLYSVAEAQAGLFTAKQARAAGFCASSHTYHVREGNWAREYRGIYRLTSFPAALRPELTRWHLWSMDRAGRAQGVYSHSSALGLYLTPETTASDLPLKLHMTVPKSFRRSGATPEGLTLHYCDLPESDVAGGERYRLTTPLRTILDLATGDLAAGDMATDLATGDLAATDTMPRAELSKALLRIAEQGLIMRAQIQSARIPEASRLQFEELLGWKKR